MAYIAVSIMLISGVMIGYWRLAPLSFLIMLAIAGFTVAALWWRKRLVTICAVCFAITCLLAARTTTILPPRAFNPQRLDNQKVKVVGTVSEKPISQKKSKSIKISQIRIDGQNQWYGAIQTNVPLFADITYGDQVEIEGVLKVNLLPQSDYDQYLFHHQVYGIIIWPTVSVISRGHGNPLLSFIYSIQDACQKAVIKWLPRDESGLLLGIVLGLQQQLSDNFNQALNNTGTTHIIVASGYNATIVIGTVLKLTNRYKRSFSLALAVTVLIAYAGLSGFNPSIIRAAVMATIAILAQVLGRQRLAIHLLILTAVAMLMANPLWIFDISFQLSFAATIGIILIEPIIYTKIKIKYNAIKEIISTTFAAQICAIPIISHAFGSVALLGLGANILVLWLIPWVMLIGAVVIPLLMIASWWGTMMVWVIEPPLWYIKHTITMSASLPYSSVNLQMPMLVCLIYYLAVIAVIWRFAPHEQA